MEDRFLGYKKMLPQLSLGEAICSFFAVIDGQEIYDEELEVIIGYLFSTERGLLAAFIGFQILLACGNYLEESTFKKMLEIYMELHDVVMETNNEEGIRILADLKATYPDQLSILDNVVGTA